MRVLYVQGLGGNFEFRVWAVGCLVFRALMSRAEELGAHDLVETCFEFKVMLEFLRTQGLGLGSRLLVG